MSVNDFLFKLLFGISYNINSYYGYIFILSLIDFVVGTYEKFLFWLRCPQSFFYFSVLRFEEYLVVNEMFGGHGVLVRILKNYIIS